MNFRIWFVGVFLVVQIVAPLTFHVNSPFDSDNPSLISIDVCQASGASLSVDSESFCICESEYTIGPLWMSGFHVNGMRPMSPFLIASRSDKPPRA